ncbi:MAG: hypothetical protein JSV82_07635, partial [Planctomycetota bacterium]
MSGRRRIVIFAACFFAAIVFIWLDDGGISRRRRAQAESWEKVKAQDFERYHEKTFSVVNIVDGDTLDIDVA